MFGDPNAEATAEAELNVLCMWTNQKFADFLIDFNMLLSQVNWGDCTLHHWLKQVLPDHIKDSLALVEEPATFNEWKCLVQNIDQRYWEQQAEIRRDAHLNSSTNTTCATPAPNVHNTLVGGPSTSAAHDMPSSPPIVHHLTAQGELMQTEWDQQIAQGLCLYCGGQGHKANKCGKVQKAREMMGRVAQLTPSESVPIGPSTMPGEPKFTVISEN